MTEPVQQTVYYYAGSDRNIQFTRASGSTDISGWSLAFAVRERRTTDGPGDVLFSCVTGTDITITDGANGVILVDVASADTLSANPGTYRWDLWRTDSGNKEWLAGGPFILLERQVTFP